MKSSRKIEAKVKVEVRVVVEEVVVVTDEAKVKVEVRVVVEEVVVTSGIEVLLTSNVARACATATRACPRHSLTSCDDALC